MYAGPRLCYVFCMQVSEEWGAHLHLGSLRGLPWVQAEAGHAWAARGHLARPAGHRALPAGCQAAGAHVHYAPQRHHCRRASHDCHVPEATHHASGRPCIG
jgi:hypothetical protein